MAGRESESQEADQGHTTAADDGDAWTQADRRACRRAGPERLRLPHPAAPLARPVARCSHQPVAGGWAG